MRNDQDIRYKQRLQNFERAFLLLRGVFETQPQRTLSDLEKEGVVQRFEFTFELAWKTLKDYLEYQGLKLEPIGPREVLKQGFAAGILKDGEAWTEMLVRRNLLSHTYDIGVFSESVDAIRNRYVKLLEELYLWMKDQAMKS